MYTLTLTHAERRAIDFVGNRYATGYDFKRTLISEHVTESDIWDADDEVTYTIPEHVAWNICNLFEQEDYLFPCFALELSSKLIEFTNEVV